MNKRVQIGDRVEVRFGSGTEVMIVDEVISDDDIRGYSEEVGRMFTGLDEIVAKHGNIMDAEPEDI